MAIIKPFRALVYNQDKIDLSKAVCPPYDVISPLRQESYHKSNEHNFLHILLAKDIPGEDKYERAGICFKEWIKNKVLVQDELPAIYFYSQQYSIKGEKKTRLGFISLLHLGEKSSAAYGHEHTRIEAKEDRLRLMKQVQANLSPIFSVFKDEMRIIQRVFKQNIDGQKPFIDITDTEGVGHKLWKIDSQEVIKKIQNALSDESIFIADGHHRYEVACAYRDEMQKKSAKWSGEEDQNYILSYFTNTDARGLSIMPIHRLATLETVIAQEELNSRLKEHFEVEEIKDKTRFFFLMEKNGENSHLLGMYMHGKYWLLRFKNIKVMDKLLADMPKEYRSLDVSILNHIILKGLLNFDLESKKNIIFTPHIDEIIKEVDGDKRKAGFFLNPVKMQQIIAVALTGNKMPAKSTYFYPKVLSGLVINKFSQEKE